MITITDEINTKIVGVTFANEDGTNRQEIIESCSEGDILSLEHYYYNGEDAFKVLNCYGEVLGNLKKELSGKLVEKYDISTLETANVEILNITGMDKEILGVNIKITIEDFDAELANGFIPLSNISTPTTKENIISITKENTAPPSKNEATLKRLHDKYGTRNLKIYSIIFKVLFIFCLLWSLFALIFSFLFAVIFGMIAFICFKYSKLYKKAAAYSK